MGTLEDDSKTGRDNKENKAKYVWPVFLGLHPYYVRVQLGVV